WWSKQQGYRRLILPAAVALGVALLALLLTRERSAWLGLMVGCTLALLSLGFFGPGQYAAGNFLRHFTVRRLLKGVMLTGVLFVVGVALLLAASPSSRLFLDNLLGTSPYDRLYIWRDALTVIQDYRFTGSGLGQTAM